MERFSIRQSGFTLLELVVITAIIALIGIIALPELHTTQENYRLKSASMDMLSYFQKAKMEAVKRGLDVVLSFSPGVNGSYQIFVDNGAGGGTAGNWTRDGGEELISQIRIGENITMTSPTSFTGNATGFDARGMPISSRIGNVQLTNINGNSYSVILSMAGSVRLKKD
jgi:type IV fimbrial biogenesis protein FimT